MLCRRVSQAAVQQAAEQFEAPMKGTVTDLRIGVEQLDPVVRGRFDIAFSTNVLEHVQDPRIALDRIESVLVDGGIQRHVCPKYVFPYEPHFFIPLVPFRPAATRWFLRAVTEPGLWQSLNFVISRTVRRWARDAGRTVELDRGVLGEAVERFLADKAFAERHSAPRASSGCWSGSERCRCSAGYRRPSCHPCASRSRHKTALDLALAESARRVVCARIEEHDVPHELEHHERDEPHRDELGELMRYFSPVHEDREQAQIERVTAQCDGEKSQGGAATHHAPSERDPSVELERGQEADRQ